MNSEKNLTNNGLLVFPVSLLSLAISTAALGQNSPSEPAVTAPPVMEEMNVVGRLVTSAENLVYERQDQPVATDYIGADQIGRIGDSTVALALTRVPGVTLVDGQFVFVRGLGERYSSTRLNGAMVPSPDLSRNVLPLDMFPTSIVQSLAIQKVPSADKPAAFGGGSVNIRTTSIPDGLLLSMELGTGINTQSSDFLTYNGGDEDHWGEDDGTRALSGDISGALDRYRGDFTPGNISRIESLTVSEAQAANRELALALNRDISVRKESGDPDIDAEVNLGNNFYLPNDMEFGVLAGAAYESQWRHYETTQRDLGQPEEQVSFEERSTYSVALTGNLSFGLNLNSENSIETTSLYLRNTDDEVAVRNYFNSNRRLSDGRGFRDTGLRYEKRELTVHQIRGEHEFGSETIETVGLDSLSVLEGLTFNWYYSDSKATTALPNEVSALSNTVADRETGLVESSSLSANSSAIRYRFSDLEDSVDSSGWVLAMPARWGDFDMTLSGGTDYWNKSRIYKQLEFDLGSTSVPGSDPLFQGRLGQVLSDQNIADPANGFRIDASGDNANSYVAANKVNAAFGNFDLTWDQTLRAVLGVRWEDYQQVNLPWDPLSYDGSEFPGVNHPDPEKAANYLRNATYAEDDVYVSTALTWMLHDFWAQDFQLRLSYGETTVRPDLREISASNYLDPLTNTSVNGNPEVVPSGLNNYDLRAEWFFANGDNFTASLFYKDITNPIELFEAAATDDNIAAEIHNAESAELRGLEVEFLKTLGEVADFLDPFFVQGNLTVMDQELVVGDRADAPTNQVRPLQGASDQVANLILGYDSYNGMHAATLSYNTFSERLFFAGRNGAPDSYEQPFHSLNFTYSFYPTDQFTVKFQAKNLLDDQIVIERTSTYADGSTEDVEVYERERGQDISLSLAYRF